MLGKLRLGILLSANRRLLDGYDALLHNHLRLDGIADLLGIVRVGDVRAARRDV